MRRPELPDSRVETVGGRRTKGVVKSRIETERGEGREGGKARRTKERDENNWAHAQPRCTRQDEVNEFGVRRREQSSCIDWNEGQA